MESISASANGRYTQIYLLIVDQATYYNGKTTNATYCSRSLGEAICELRNHGIVMSTLQWMWQTIYFFYTPEGTLSSKDGCYAPSGVATLTN